jgi:hypothetical protein
MATRTAKNIVRLFVALTTALPEERRTCYARDASGHEIAAANK